MTGPPACTYGQPCHWDDDTGTCSCDDDQPPEPERTVEDVPEGPDKQRKPGRIVGF